MRVLSTEEYVRRKGRKSKLIIAVSAITVAILGAVVPVIMNNL